MSQSTAIRVLTLQANPLEVAKRLRKLQRWVAKQRLLAICAYGVLAQSQQCLLLQHGTCMHVVMLCLFRIHEVVAVLLQGVTSPQAGVSISPAVQAGERSGAARPAGLNSTRQHLTAAPSTSLQK